MRPGAYAPRSALLYGFLVNLFWGHKSGCPVSVGDARTVCAHSLTYSQKMTTERVFPPLTTTDAPWLTCEQCAHITCAVILPIARIYNGRCAGTTLHVDMTYMQDEYHIYVHATRGRLSCSLLLHEELKVALRVRHPKDYDFYLGLEVAVARMDVCLQRSVTFSAHLVSRAGFACLMRTLAQCTVLSRLQVYFFHAEEDFPLCDAGLCGAGFDPALTAECVTQLMRAPSLHSVRMIICDSVFPDILAPFACAGVHHLYVDIHAAVDIALLAFLERNDTVRELDCDVHMIQSWSLIDAAARIIKCNTALRNLRMCQRGVIEQNYDAPALVSALAANTTLCRLHIDLGAVDDATSALLDNGRLVYLAVGINPNVALVDRRKAYVGRLVECCMLWQRTCLYSIPVMDIARALVALHTLEDHHTNLMRMLPIELVCYLVDAVYFDAEYLGDTRPRLEFCRNIH